MASRPPPRFVVRRHDDTGQRQRWWWVGAAWLISLLLTGLLVGMFSHRATPPATVSHGNQRKLLSEIETLKQEVANLQRAAQVNDIATRSVRGTLAQREEELSALRADLGFYSRLVGGDAQRQGLKLQEVKLQPIVGSRGWNLSLSLTQNAKRGDELTGHVMVSVEGLQNNKVARLEWPALGDTTQKDGLPFRFTYFQQLHGSIVLPAGFRPTRLRIHVQPTSGGPVDRAVAWGDALSGNITNSEGDHDAQP